MKISTRQKRIRCGGIRISYRIGRREIARARLYILKNDLHSRPFGFLEDVFVDPEFRGQGLGKRINEEVIRAATEAGCYKIVATSRFERKKVHAMYKDLGYEEYGIEFRRAPFPRDPGLRVGRNKGHH